MTCFRDGQPVTADSGLTVVYDQAEAVFSTSSFSYVAVTGSSLTVPAGNWLLHYSIELIADYPSYNLAGCELQNQTDTTQIATSMTQLTDLYGWTLHGGIYRTTFASPKTYRWRIAVFAGGGPVGCQRARIMGVRES